jgi:hypothetical protein
MSLRDSEFAESLESFIAMSTLDTSRRLPPEKVNAVLYHSESMITFQLDGLLR